MKIILDILVNPVSKDKGTFVGIGDFMERFTNYVGVMIEFLIISFIFLLILPFRLIYHLGRRLVTK